MAATAKKIPVFTIDADLSLELERSSAWWIPRILSFCFYSLTIALAFSLISLASVFFSGPRPVVRVITDSGVVIDVNAKQ